MLIAAAFAAYFHLNENLAPPQPLGFLVACIGFLFSLGWYLANRGSKFWQENWERHVDNLEDEFMGPLYKAVLDWTDMDWWDWRTLHKGYPFSVSKINQLLSLFITLIWVTLWLRTFHFSFIHLILTLITVIFGGLLLSVCQSDLSSRKRMPREGRVEWPPSVTCLR